MSGFAASGGSCPPPTHFALRAKWRRERGLCPLSPHAFRPEDETVGGGQGPETQAAPGGAAPVCAVVVVYRTRCAESPACQSLLRQTAPANRVLVVDNSETDLGNHAFCQAQGWMYDGGKGNRGLSRAYNAAINLLRPQAGGSAYLCLLDDDTVLPVDFFQTVRAHTEKRPAVDVWLPVLTQNGQVLSPWKADAPKSKRFFESPEQCLAAGAEGLLAFNSGMVIRMAVFDSYRYDQRVFLDGVDYLFLGDMRRQGRTVALLPSVCGQSFSGNERPPLQGALTRFRLYARDFRVVYERQPWRYVKLVGRRAVHLTLRYRTPKFLWLALKPDKPHREERK